VNGPYETLLQQSVNSGTADIVTSNFPLVALFAAAQRQINRASLAGSVKG
jgi:hypothetical protein